MINFAASSLAADVFHVGARIEDQAADAHERANGRLFREVEFALPRELNEGEQIELAREFSRRLTCAEAMESGCPTRWPCIAARGRTPTPT